MKILVIGSGASGVHFARSALERGHAVELIDLGFAPEPAVAPEASFPELFGALPDPIGYFLGRDGGHVVYPSPAPKFYGFPPTKDYVFRQPAGVPERRPLTPGTGLRVFLASSSPPAVVRRRADVQKRVRCHP